MESEYSLLRVPYEQLSKVFKNTTRAVEKEIQQVVGAIAGLSKKKDVKKEEAFNTFTKLSAKLQSLKKKLEDISKDEENLLDVMNARLHHMQDFNEHDEKARTRWHKIKLDRILIDYLLREGLYDTAIMFAKDSKIESLVDIDVFVSGHKVIESLQQGNSAEALKWCQENKARLKKIESDFEFQIRIQEFLDLVKNGKTVEAIQYARDSLSASAESNMSLLQQAMATLAFPNPHTAPQFKELFDAERWNTLVLEFKKENYRLNSVSSQALLSLHLQAGISALKTPQCFREDSKNFNCPICSDLIGQMAKDLPAAQHTHSTLVCRVTGDIMNEDNPPYVLPSGYVYSKRALDEMSMQNNGIVRCTVTEQEFGIDEANRLFIT
jgi:macrophage erythroblast attacher